MSDAAALSHLINAYFHQDWTFEGSTATEVLAVFRRENGEPTVAAAARAAQDLVTRELTEDALMETLAGLGLQYDPSYEHMTYHQWLALVAEMS